MPYKNIEERKAYNQRWRDKHRKIRRHGSGGKWLPHEDEIIYNHSEPVMDFIHLLPGRTETAIYARRQNLKCTTRPSNEPWRSCEDEIIRKHHNEPVRENMKLLPGRTEGAIYSRRQILGVATAKLDKVEYICLECNKKFLAAPSPPRKFCCKEHKFLYRNKNATTYEIGQVMGSYKIMEHIGFQLGEFLQYGVKKEKRPRDWWLIECITCGNKLTCTREQMKLRKHHKCVECKDLPNGYAGFQLALSQYKRGAKGRDYPFTLTNLECKNLFEGNCFYCGDEPKQFSSKLTTWGRYHYNGIDRIDNEKGYIPDNCVSCCCLCNRLKGTFEQGKFLNQVKKIALHQ